MKKQPFQINQLVRVITNFDDIRDEWPMFNYPWKGDIVKIKGYSYRESDDQWFFSIEGCNVPELHYSCFEAFFDISSFKFGNENF